MPKQPTKKKAATAKKEKAVKKPLKETTAVKQPKAPVKAAVKVEPKEVKKVLKNYFYANGKRKTSVASVRLFAGKGSVTINSRTFDNYFPLSLDQDKVISPLRLTNTQKAFDITVQVCGGGIHSQAEAIRHGISKALLLYNGELRTTLKHAGFLTRDSRVKERKKYGLKRARRAPQWAKR